MLDGIASLITAVAALVTAMSGMLGVIYLLRKGSSRERKDAAKGVISNLPIVGNIVQSEASDQDD